MSTTAIDHDNSQTIGDDPIVWTGADRIILQIRITYIIYLHLAHPNRRQKEIRVIY